MATEILATPTLHNNGTSAADLFKQYADAVKAIEKAITALPKPHGRDYYVQGPDAYKRAESEYVARLAMLQVIEADLQSILENITNQRDGHPR